MQSHQHREAETGVVPFRSGRYFVAANKWYFTTREGMDKGPFNSKHDAELYLTEFLEHCKKINKLFH